MRIFSDAEKSLPIMAEFVERFQFLWKRIVQMNDDTMPKCIQGYVSAMH